MTLAAGQLTGPAAMCDGRYLERRNAIDSSNTLGVFDVRGTAANNAGFEMEKGYFIQQEIPYSLTQADIFR